MFLTGAFCWVKASTYNHGWVIWLSIPDPNLVKPQFHACQNHSTWYDLSPDLSNPNGWNNCRWMIKLSAIEGIKRISFRECEIPQDQFCIVKWDISYHFLILCVINVADVGFRTRFMGNVLQVHGSLCEMTLELQQSYQQIAQLSHA